MKLPTQIKDKKRIAVLAALLLIGTLILLLPNGESHTADDSVQSLEVSTYAEKLESRLCELCSHMSGVGEVRVLVTLECGSETVYAENRTENFDSTSSAYSADYLIIESGDGETPVTVKQIYPQIRGVAVVCDGGASPSIKAKLISLLSAALGIPTSKISVSS